MQIIDVLIKSRELVDDYWVPHCPNSRDNEQCAVTAISTVVGGYSNAKLFRITRDAVKAAVGLDCYDELSEWNDSHSKQEVLAAFDKAIETEMRRHNENAD